MKNTPQSTLKFILTGILPINTDASIDPQQENNLLTLSITAPEELKGRIIGKQGKIIKAIRAIISISYPDQNILIKVID